jgi:hypothetical protein
MRKPEPSKREHINDELKIHEQEVKEEESANKLFNDLAEKEAREDLERWEKQYWRDMDAREGLGDDFDDKPEPTGADYAQYCDDVGDNLDQQINEAFDRLIRTVDEMVAFLDDWEKEILEQEIDMAFDRILFAAAFEEMLEDTLWILAIDEAFERLESGEVSQDPGDEPVRIQAFRNGDFIVIVPVQIKSIDVDL